MSLLCESSVDSVFLVCVGLDIIYDKRSYRLLVEKIWDGMEWRAPNLAAL